MNTHRFPSQVVLKGFLAVLLVLLAFQSLIINGLAAPDTSSHYFQEEGKAQTLTCDSSYRDIQIVLLIDDSGSMRTNDPQFVRNENTKNLVDILLRQYYLPALQRKDGNRDLPLPNIQVAIIHFSKEVIENSEWIKISPDNWKVLVEFIDRNKRYPYDNTQYTHFEDPFTEAAELITSDDVQTAETDCTRRSILLFTDSAPEDLQGILHGEDLTSEMQGVKSAVQGLSNLNVRIYVTGFNVNPNYVGEVEPLWSTALAFPTPSQDEVLLRSVLFSTGKDALIRSATRAEEITASLIDVQRSVLNPVTQDTQPYFVDIPKNIQSLRLTLYNLDPDAELLITDPNGNKITADGERAVASGNDTPIEVWQLITPQAGMYKVQASKAGGIITGLFPYPMAIPTATRTSTPTATPTATHTFAQTSTPTVSVTPTINSTSPCSGNDCLPCECNRSWRLWFWPLAILLTGLLIILLVFKFRSEQTKKNDREGQRDILRTNHWHLLFLPLLILLIFLVLNRLWWCCIIPPWLFLALILILTIIHLPVGFVSKDIVTRRRSWWLVILLLLSVLIWSISFRYQPISLPAILLILFLGWMIRWYILPIQIPPPHLPDSDQPKKDNDDGHPSADDLNEIEGIDDTVKQLLKEKFITTFKQLAETDSRKIKSWLNEKSWFMMNPDTWPKQAELKYIAQTTGKKVDEDVFKAYLIYLKGGRASDMQDKSE